MEENMKKYLMIILALVLIFALVVGCAPKEATELTEPEATGTQGQVEPETPTGLAAQKLRFR